LTTSTLKALVAFRGELFDTFHFEPMKAGCVGAQQNPQLSSQLDALGSPCARMEFRKLYREYVCRWEGKNISQLISLAKVLAASLRSFGELFGVAKFLLSA
jgi:hypothetical protein